VAALADVHQWRVQSHSVHLDEKVKRYIVEIVAVTREREAEYIDFGASPRATLALANLSRARALLQERDYVVPDDVRAVAPAALRHRIGFNFRVNAEKPGAGAGAIIERLIAAVPVP
jgi:MoxR-like ATPase